MRPPQRHAVSVLTDLLASAPHEAARLDLNRLTPCCIGMRDAAPVLALLHRVRAMQSAGHQILALEEAWGDPRQSPRTFVASIALLRRERGDWLWPMVYAVLRSRGIARRHVLQAYRRQGFQPDTIRLDRFTIENAGLAAGSYLSTVFDSEPADFALLIWHDLLRSMDDSEWRILFGKGLPHSPEWPHLAANRHGVLLRWKDRFPWPEHDTSAWTRLLDFAAQGAPRRVLWFLLGKGAVVTPQALQNALRRGRPDLMDLLESHAKPGITLTRERLYAVVGWIRPCMARHVRRHLGNEAEKGPVFHSITAEGVRAFSAAGLRVDRRLPFDSGRAAAPLAAIQAGVSAIAQDNDGNTPLHHARSAAVAKVLLRHGADPLVINKEGVTAFRAAMQAKRLSVATGMADSVIQSGLRERIQALLREWIIVTENWETPSAKNHGDLIRLPGNRRAQVRALMQAQSDFMAEHGRAPSDAELAKRMGTSVRILDSIRKARLTLVALDTPIASGSDLRVADTLAAPESTKDLDADSLHAHLRAAMKVLAPRDRELLERHFGLGAHQARTCEDLAAVFGCSRSTLSERKTAALARLRAVLAPFRAEFQVAGRTPLAA